MRLFIKNITNLSSVKELKTILAELDICYEKEIMLGELMLTSSLSQDKYQELKKRLEDIDLTILYDRKQILAEQVKYLVYELLGNEEPPRENYSHFISKRLFLNYTYLANIFSETQGITIEHFIINEKIKRVKELLLYDDYSISQVADMLHYSSIGHLSNQFKKVTGLNPSQFKKDAQKKAMS